MTASASSIDSFVSGAGQPSFAEKAVVLLPTYNERDNIQLIVPAILEAAPVDVWILDDASPDGTGDLADALAQDNPRVRVTHRAGKEGLGPAYIAGFRLALAQGYGRILQMDADFSHDPKYLPELLKQSQEYDVVLGSRWVKGGGTRNWSLLRQGISRGGSFYARTVLGLPFRDLTGGFKCFRRKVLESIDLDSVAAKGYAFQIEITYRACCAGFKVLETPIVFADRVRGDSKMSTSVITEAVVQVPKLRLKKASNR